ncbi:MAG TPA: YfcE family phosphodiesterase [Myxococcota bacterium]|nr:YfcE family phosphodiesterase [Myxococcota bacterium]
MRVGVISDTHDNARNVARIVEVLRGARVERVIHTGDITRPATLELLAELAVPVFGVFGNNDTERDALSGVAARHGFALADPPLHLHWAGRHVTVVHDRAAHPELADGGRDVLLHGHDHRRSLERRNGVLIFNPGECAGWLEGRNAVGVLDLVRLDADVLHF